MYFPHFIVRVGSTPSTQIPRILKLKASIESGPIDLNVETWDRIIFHAVDRRQLPPITGIYCQTTESQLPTSLGKMNSKNKRWKGNCDNRKNKKRLLCLFFMWSNKRPSKLPFQRCWCQIVVLVSSLYYAVFLTVDHPPFFSISFLEESRKPISTCSLFPTNREHFPSSNISINCYS